MPAISGGILLFLHRSGLVDTLFQPGHVRRTLHSGRVLAYRRRLDASSLRSKVVKTPSDYTHAAGQALADLHTRKWQLVSAVCVERSPIVSALKTTFENEWTKLMERQEFEMSLLSDHEIEKIQEAKKAKRKTDVGSLVDEEVVLETIHDREDKWTDQFVHFKPQSRETEEDKNGDLKSLNRSLHRKLYFAAHQTLGETTKWVFPQRPWEAGESLHETAQRALRSTCGDRLHVNFLGSVPFGFYKYKYPDSAKISQEFYGAKVFFFKALLDTKKSKSLELTNDVVDYKWLTREELEKCFLHQYFDRVERFLFEFDSPSLSTSEDHEDLVKLKY